MEGNVIAGLFFVVGIAIGIVVSRRRRKAANPGRLSGRRSGSPTTGGSTAPSRKRRGRRK
ncbi:MAG TPA: hypothetical protein VFD42_04700 [Chloroflexota bacterium]|nr:hypothetical protein [Chloroflexota bacterium]